MPGKEQVEAEYLGSRGEDYHRVKRGIPTQAIPWVAALRAAKIQSHVRANDVVLEYGVGSGWNLVSLQCVRKVGFDVSHFLKSEVENAGIEFCEKTESLPDGFADVVICHHTLEHVANPIDVLLEIRRLLKAGGKLLLFVPYEKEGRYREFDPAEPNHHLYSWNVQTLGNLVVSAGYEFRDGQTGQFGYDRFAAKWAVKLGLGENGFRFIRSFAHLLRPASEVRVIATKK